MLYIGCHLSASKGYLHMGKTATAIDANTFQFFTRNPRGGNAKAFDAADAAALNTYMRENGIQSPLAHAPYTYNPCAEKPDLRAFARRAMAEDLQVLEYIDGAMYNFHPGSHVGQGAEAGIALIADTLNAILQPEGKTKVLLETMAGKGSEVGGCFEELAEIIKRTEHNARVGVCLDTCHVHDGGYDIVNDLDGVLEAFDRTLGIDRLCAIHLNDSLNPCGAHKDRHAKIGEGYIGTEAFVRIITHPQLRNLPFYLETPNELEGYAKEIALLRGFFY